MTLPELDDIDRRILDLLRADARRTVADIARQVNLSQAPVARRIDRLEATGVIAGYTVLVNQEKIGQQIERSPSCTSRAPPASTRSPRPRRACPRCARCS